MTVKTNAYTTAIETIHAPSSAIENALKAAKCPKKKSRHLLPIGIAAAIAAAVIGMVLIYGVYIEPKAQLILDSGESVTVTLNSRGKVLEAKGYPALGGKSAEEAIEAIVNKMMEDDKLTKDENTLIIGTSGNDLSPEQAAECVNGAFDDAGFDGCTIAIAVENDIKTQRRQSATRACVINLLNTYEPTFSVENLSKLTSNELGLLLVKNIQNEDILITGAPSESAYIGFDGAMQKALRLSEFRENELSDASVVYSVYHGRLIYLVRLNAGDNSEAYFINAITGATEEAVKASSKEIDKVVNEAIGKPSPVQDPTQYPTDTVVAPSAAPFTDAAPIDDEANTDSKPFVDDPTTGVQATEKFADQPTSSLHTQAATTAESADYKTIPVTLTELSFVVASPSDNAREIAYQTLFEGQFLEDRRGEKTNGGEMAVITNSSQLRAFLKEHDYRFTDHQGHTLNDRYDSDYFKTHFILASACTVSDASYYTTVTRLCSDGGMIYTENSLSYGAARSGEYFCHTLSLYGVSRSEASSALPITVY